MIFVTELMNKIFSDADPNLADAVTDKIEEAKKNGSAVLDDGKNKLNFAEVNGNVVIEDKKNDEITVAKEGADGTTKLEALPKEQTKTQSATEPDVIVPQPAGETKPVLPEDSTEPNVIVDITPAITDPDKAGLDKNFSLTFSGFESEEEAAKFYSEYFEDTYTFSDDEVENMVYSANELTGMYERMLGTEDATMAFSVIETAEQLKAYSVLAEANGHDMSEVIEVCNAYSEDAENMLYSITADTDVNEFFSDMTEEDLTAYFSELDPYQAEVLYSALESSEPMTFSEAEEAAQELKEEAALNEEVGEAIKDMSDDEMDAVFSEMTDQELDVLYSVMESNPNATFSDINEALDSLYMPLNEMFSDMTDEELAEFTSNYSDSELELLNSMYSDENENYTFSDFLDVVEETSYFSDSDCETLAENANQLTEAAEDMAASGDPHLAAKVLVVADKIKDQCEAAENAGHDVGSVKEAVQQFSEEAIAILENNDIDPESVDENNTNIYGEFEDMDTNHDGMISKDEWDAAHEEKQAEKCDQVAYSDYVDDSTRYFGDVNYGSASNNPYLTSTIN